MNSCFIAEMPDKVNMLTNFDFDFDKLVSYLV